MSSLSIAAVVISHGAGEFLERTLKNLSDQTYPLEQVVVVDTASEDGAIELASRHEFSAIQPGDLRLGAAIDAGIAALASRPSWIWILHDDSAPEPEALRQLAKAAEISPSVAIIGPKLLSWDHPIEIQQMGLTVTPTGRPFLRVEREYDQGQHDSSTDTLAVSTAGMLISLGLWQKIGGIDDSTPVFAQDVELGMRARAAGFRVIVEASARVHHAGLAMAGRRSKKWVGGNRRQGLSRAHLHLATAILPLPLIVLLYLALPLIAILAIPANLLGKNPGRSLAQLSGWLWAWLTFPKRFSARARSRSFGSLSQLRTLFATPDQIKRRRRSQLDLEVEPKNPVRGIFGSGAILFALVPLALSFARFPQGATSSDNLAPLGRSLSDVWRSVGADTLSYLDGIAAPTDPFNWFFALLALFSPQQPSLALSAFVFAAPAILFVGVWLLLSAVATKPWVRTAAALVFSLSPQLMGLSGQAAVVELAALAGFVFAAYFLNQSVLAFNSARAWRWMSLAGFAGAVTAVASPPLFLLLILISLWIAAQRPSRIAISLWFVIPGIGLIAPWFIHSASLSQLQTSSARIASNEPSLETLISLGALGLLFAIGFGFGRIRILIGLTLLAALALLSTRIDLFGAFGELWALVLLAVVIGISESLQRLPKRSGHAAIGTLAIGAVASGIFFGALQSPKFEFQTDRQLPALVVALADVDPGTRTLLIDFSEQIEVDLIWGDGRSQEEISLLYQPQTQSRNFQTLIANLAASLIAGNPAGLAELIATSSTDFVLLRGDAAEVAQARVAIGSTALVQESGDTDFGLLFRVLEPNQVSVPSEYHYREIQLGILAAFLLISLPTPATIRGYRRIRGGR